MTSPPRTDATPGAALLAVLALPASIGLLIPAAIMVFDPWRRSLETPSVIIGGVVTASGLVMTARTVIDFFAVGRGTLAPWDPPRHLVTTGLFAHSRNPMYLGVLAVLAGLAMASRSPILGGYLVAAAVGFHLRVILHEEPWANRTFGPDWASYRSTVPRWLPRPRRRSETEERAA